MPEPSLVTPRYSPTRPRAAASMYLGHGLGNDYLVVEPGEAWTLSDPAVQAVCHRLEGVGSDGIVALVAPVRPPFELRMFNPDGSEFERSGNGLRIVASHLVRSGRVQPGEWFPVVVGGETVKMNVHSCSADGVYDISVEMGHARVGVEAVEAQPDLPVEPGPGVRHLVELPEIGVIPVVLVSTGNPHCVVFADGLPSNVAGRDGEDAFSLATLRRIGLALATHRVFPRGVNVQLARSVSGSGAGPGESVVDAFVWERGAGHTTASGTSACAVAVAACHTGRAQPGTITVRMEGGELQVTVHDNLEVLLRGPVQEVMDARVSGSFLRRFAE